MDRNKWAEGQARELLELGIDAIEAQRSIKWVLDNMPIGADPNEWIPAISELDEGVSDADIQDARADWYASDSVPPAFKRLLDARQADA